MGSILYPSHGYKKCVTKCETHEHTPKNAHNMREFMSKDLMGRATDSK